MRRIDNSLRLGALIILSAAIGACDDRDQATVQSVNVEPVADPDLRLASSPTLSRAQPSYFGIESTEELLSSLPHEHQSLTMAFYSGYDRVAIEFATKEQLAWLINNGYPMPNDIVAASRMSDTELLKLHQQGNALAGIFLLDRVAFNSDEMAPAERSKLNSIATDILVRGSPFAGYVYSRYQLSKGDSHSALAGYAWAAWLGDTRAASTMGKKSYSIQLQGNSQLQPEVVAMATINLFGTIQALNPSLLSRDHDYFPQP